MKDTAYSSLHGMMPPLTVMMNKPCQDIGDIVRSLITYYFPGASSIWDPTCGSENHQFRKYLKMDGAAWVYAERYRYVASDIKDTKWNCGPQGCLKIDVLKTPHPFGDGEFDIIVYDPPFQPSARHDDRGGDYGIDVDRRLEDIQRYYDLKVFEEFARIAGRGLIVKCTDFYYPPYSSRLRLCLGDLIKIDEMRRIGLRPAGIHILRFVHNNVPLMRARLAKAFTRRGVRRAMTVHSYYIVFYKEQ